MPPAKSKRRWFQYSLRSLMLLMTLAVGLLAAWRVYVEPYRRQREAMQVIERLGGRYETAQSSKWIRRLAAEEIQDLTLVDVSNYDTPLAYLEHVRRLPRLETLIVGGPNFGDDELWRLRRLGTLKWLILDSTSVSDEGIAALREKLPELNIHRSQRRAIAALQQTGNNIATLNLVLPRLFSVPSEHCRIATEVRVQAGYGEPLLVHLRAINTLASLDLTGRYLSDKSLEGLPQLRGLRKLCLANTWLSDAHVAELKDLSQLRSLHLGYNHITDAGLAHVAELKDLEELVLAGTQVTDDGLRRLAMLTNLRRLSLFGLSISDGGLEHLQGLTQLTSLDLFGNPIGDDGLARLKALTSLQELDLTATRVTDAGMMHLRELTSLQELSLSATNVGDAGLVHLARLPKLRRLSVTSAGVTWRGIQRFKQLCPNCEVMDINRFRDNRITELPP